MGENGGHDVVTCIVCDRSFPTSEPAAYQPLEHFADACICRECLARHKTGYPRPQVRRKSS
ncbi:MAG TPA: hypothetical protein VF282_07345 [Bacillota bacterium]